MPQLRECCDTPEEASHRDWCGMHPSKRLKRESVVPTAAEAAENLSNAFRIEDNIEWNKYADFLNQVFPGLDGLEGEQYESAVDQLRVMVEVLAIMIERNKKYRDLWRKAGWLSHVHHIRHKAARLMNTFWGQKEVPKDADLDDAFDLINYTIYFIRSYRDGNERGTLW